MANTSVIVIPEGKICDYVDGKFRNDTPEEYVRQTIEKRLVNEHKYLPKQIRIEYTLQLGSRKPRADIVIFDKDCGEQTQENIKIIIECKKEAVEARNAKDGVEQLKSYMSACPNCEWGMWTNGRQKEVYHKYVNDKGQIDFMDYNDIPSADGNLDDINRPKRTTLKNAYDDNLLFTFKTCHNHIYVNDGLQKQPAFFELLKVIFCNLCWGLNQQRFLFFSYKRFNRATYPASTYYRKLITSFLPNPSANACKVATVGLQEPLSMRLILD